MTFEGSFALSEPGGKLKERGRFLAGESEGRVDEGIGLDESAIEVDAKRRESCVGELVDGKQGCRQRSDPS